MNSHARAWGCVVGSVFVVVIALTELAGPAAAVTTTRYVNNGSASCSDSGSGTISQPYCTIIKAAAVATAGETVQVSSGLYGGVVTFAQSGTSSAPIVFDAVPSGTVTVAGGTNGFKVSSKNWIKIEGFNVTQTTGEGISVSGASNVTIENNTVSYAGHPVVGQTSPGIKLSSTTASLVVDNVTRNNSDHGISLGASPANVIRKNESYSNARQVARAAAGIFLAGSTGNIVNGNSSHDNEDSGIGLWNGSNNSVVFNNVVSNNGDHGIDVLQSTGEAIVANTVYKSVDSGIEMQGSAGANLVNNITVDNGINSPRTAGNIRVVDSGSAALTTLDYDLVYLSSTSDMIDYLGVKYASLAAFQAARGKELNGKQGDPKFSNAAAGNFHLLAGSPAIDSANSGAANQPATDRDGVVRTDDPGTPNTGAGPRTFDDRGAYEFTSPK
jgi:parallel beta-helix repeat protein